MRLFSVFSRNSLFCVLAAAFFIGLFFLSGCLSHGNDSRVNPDANVGSTDQGALTGEMTTVNMRIVLPCGSYTATGGSLLPAVVSPNDQKAKSDTASLSAGVSRNIVPPQVTFSLIILNFGNATQATALRSMTVAADENGMASTTFTAVPVTTIIGDIHIEGGHIGSFTDFHGVVDALPNVLTMVDVSPKKSGMEADIAASAIERVIASPSLFLKAKYGIAAAIRKILSGLNLSSTTLIEDVLNVYVQTGTQTDSMTGVETNTQTSLDTATVVNTGATTTTQISTQIDTGTGSSTGTGAETNTQTSLGTETGSATSAGTNTQTGLLSDTTPPVISDITSSNIGTNFAAITWITDEEADTQVEYGTTTAYGTISPLDTTKSKTHTVSLIGLVASTTYHFRVKSKDAANNPAPSLDRIFTTLPLPAPEIKVLWNGVVISNNAETASSSNGTDFGNATMTVGPITRTFTIENTGNAVMNLSGSPVVAVSGVNAGDFSVEIQPSTAVLASLTTTFVVKFLPTATGTRVATISFINNVSGKTPFSFAVRGNGLPNSIRTVSFSTVLPRMGIGNIQINIIKPGALSGYDNIATITTNIGEKALVKLNALSTASKIVLYYSGVAFDVVSEFSTLNFSNSLPFGASIEVYDASSNKVLASATVPLN